MSATQQTISIALETNFVLMPLMEMEERREKEAKERRRGEREKVTFPEHLLCQLCASHSHASPYVLHMVLPYIIPTF